MSKWLKYFEVEKKSKTQVYNVSNKETNVYLGEIKWYSQWRQYCFFPETNTLFSLSCIKDIEEFLDELNTEHKRKLIEEKAFPKKEGN